MDGEEWHHVHPYSAPGWATHLKNIPKHRVKLANVPTPIQKWDIPGIPDDFTVHIKRDDLTGAELSGNKVRSLEFLFADALAQGCRHVVAAGYAFSSNSRAVALVAASLGVTSHSLYAADEMELAGKSNVLLSRLAGSLIYRIPICGVPEMLQRLQKLTEYISSSYGEPCYSIALGSSSVLGVFGYIAAFQELLEQGVPDRFDDVIVAVSTAGTATGLAIGNYLTGSQLRIHGVSVGPPKDVITKVIDDKLDELGLADVRAETIINIIDGYRSNPSEKTSDQTLEFIASVCGSTGLLLDRYYTGKSGLAMMSELTTNPSIFKGKRLLFYHTGGMFSLFDGEINLVLDTEESAKRRVRLWPDIDISPM